MDIKRLNTQLDDLMAKGEEAYKRNLAGIGYVSAEVIKNAILDTDSQKDGLLELLADYNDEYKKRIGIDRCTASFQKFKRTLPILRDFIVVKCDRNDISVKELDYQFMVDFDFYLSTTLRMVPSTVNGFIARLHLIAASDSTSGCQEKDYPQRPVCRIQIPQSEIQPPLPDDGEPS